MVKILTEEWVKAFGNAINENTNYKPSALTWEGDMLLVIEPSGKLDHTGKINEEKLKHLGLDNL